MWFAQWLMGAVVKEFFESQWAEWVDATRQISELECMDRLTALLCLLLLHLLGFISLSPSSERPASW